VAEPVAETTEDAYQPLLSVVKAAWAAGAPIDLSGVTYGQPHWEGPVPTQPYSYYRFLAGLVRLHGFTRILEIGTHFGGSALAMCRGMPPGKGGHLLTIDVSFENAETLREERRIQRFRGDALKPEVIAAAAKAFHHLPIDLLYVDADHEFAPTLSMLSIYAELLKPRYIVLDDVDLNDSMRAMWRLLLECHPDEALDITKVMPDIQAGMIAQVQGFGLIRLR
jgi:Methyltransferase domain